MDCIQQDSPNIMEQRIAPFLSDLRRYCRKITGQPWEADDLLQEVLLRVWHALSQQPDRPLRKAYLHRIATTAWTDLCRRNQRAAAPTDAEVPEISSTPDEFDVREALETLGEHLTAKQAVAILLVDVFQFTAKETGQFLSMTKGAVEALLRRARTHLTALRQSARVERSTISESSLAVSSELAVSGELMEAFVTAFRQGNPTLIYKSYLALVAARLRVERIEPSSGQVRFAFYFKDPDGNLMMVSN